MPTQASAPAPPAPLVTVSGRPPLELTVEIASAAGTRYRWDPSARSAQDRPTGLRLSSAVMEGFKTMGCSLARRIDQDFPDLHLWDDVAVVGADGSVAWEGRLAAIPRSLDGGHSIAVDAVGWIAHMKDRRFREVYVDPSVSEWRQMSNTRRAFLLSLSRRLSDMSLPVDSIQRAIVTSFMGPWTATFTPRCEAWYDAGPGCAIGRIYLDPVLVANVSAGDPNWHWLVGAASDDGVSAPWFVTRPATGYHVPADPYTMAFLQFGYLAGPAGTQDMTYQLDWRNVTVYGDHDVPLIGTDPMGVAASEVLKDIVRRFCPKLNTDGVRDTSYPIRHLKFADSTFPYDAALLINGYHLWNLGVWERKTVHYEPFDLTDYDWEVRLSDPGVRVQLHGDTTETLANGIEVTYVDALTGKPARLTPDDTPELADTSVENEANRHGLQVWTQIDISSPIPTEDAIQLGRVALAEFNQPKAPGTITVTGGYIRDRAGHWQQGWKVRAGQRVAIVDHPNSRPRLIVEPSWDDATKTLTIPTDSTLKRLDAILDRFGTALGAAGLA